MPGERVKNGTGMGRKQEVQGWGLNSRNGPYLCAGHGTTVRSDGREWGQAGCGSRAICQGGWSSGGVSALWGHRTVSGME